MIAWHHRLNGHEFEEILGDSEGQGSLSTLQLMGSQRVRHDNNSIINILLNH